MRRKVRAGKLPRDLAGGKRTAWGQNRAARKETKRNGVGPSFDSRDSRGRSDGRLY